MKALDPTVMDMHAVEDTQVDIEMAPKMASPHEGLFLDFEPKFTTLKKRDITIKLEWVNIEFRVGGTNPKKQKTLLKGISGEASPGEVVAIMGPSGSGKTTLLNVLAGRITGGHGGKTLSGSLKANGEVVKPTQFRRRVAYVTQEDALFATATAREALEFSARLRLPRSTVQADRQQLVDDMIESLGLTKCQNTMIGSELIRGLSGGERKRVAIGVELVSSPNVLFLDEPTSGLDSYSAWKVVRILKCLAEMGCTILCSIHQPSSEVFNEFTSLIFLGQGQVVYQGSINEVDEPFRALGMGVPLRTNVADHVMLLIQTRPWETLPNDNENKRRYAKISMNGGMDVGETATPVKINKPNKSRFLMKTFSKMGSAIFRSPDDDNLGANWWVQAGWLARREFLGTCRDKAGLLGRFGGTAFLNVLFAVLFLFVGDQRRSTYTTNSHFGAIVQIWIGALFGSAQPAILTFPLERVVFIREKSTNTYATVPYVFAKLLVELPLSFLTALLTMLISYWTMALGGNFILLVLPLWGLMLAATSTAYILGSVASNARAALELGPVVLVPQILFLGFFIQINQMPIFLQWVQYLVATKYSLDIAMLVEFNPDRAISPTIRQDWINLLQFNLVTYDMTWFYCLMLFVIFAGFRIISLILLNERAKRFES